MIRYKAYNTPQQLASLSEFSLESAGVEKDLRKSVLAAVRKTGYKEKPRPRIAGGTQSMASTGKSSNKLEVRPSRVTVPLPN